MIGFIMEAPEDSATKRALTNAGMFFQRRVSFPGCCGKRNSMQISEEKRGGFTVIGLSGRLDPGSSPDVQEKLMSLIDQGESRLILDLSELSYVSSVGLRVLILLAKNVQRAKGTLALAGLSEHVYAIFKIAGFTSIFSIYPTCDEAVADSKITAHS